LSLERIYQALVSLGISQTEARIYIFLALKGPKKTKNIIDNLKISKQQIIQSLKNLQNRGIIITEHENKKTFSALPFEEVLESLISAEKKQTKKIGETKETLLSNLKEIINKNSTSSQLR